MADVDYPIQLPLPRNSDVRYFEGAATIQIPLAKGAPVTEKASDDQQVFYELVWIMKPQELRALRGFWDLILNKGTEWFNMSLQWRGTNLDFVTTQEVNFNGSDLTVRNIGKLRSVSANVIVRNPTRI